MYGLNLQWIEVSIAAGALFISILSFIVSFVTVVLLYQEFQRSKKLNRLQVRLQFVSLQKEVFEEFRSKVEIKCRDWLKSKLNPSDKNKSLGELTSDVTTMLYDMRQFFPKCDAQCVFDKFENEVLEIQGSVINRTSNILEAEIIFYSDFTHALLLLYGALQREYTSILKDHLD